MSADSLATAVTSSHFLFGSLATLAPTTFCSLFRQHSLDTAGGRLLVRSYGIAMAAVGVPILLAAPNSPARRQACQASAFAGLTTAFVHLLAMINGDTDLDAMIRVALGAGVTGLFALLSAMR